MISNPKIGKVYQIWYAEKNHHLPYHADWCEAIISGSGKPRNHLVRIIFNNNLVVIPCGNLRPINGGVKWKKIKEKD